MTTHSGILAWETPWTEEPGGLQDMGLPRVGHDLVAEHTDTVHFREGAHVPPCSVPLLCLPESSELSLSQNSPHCILTASSLSVSQGQMWEAPVGRGSCG